ncbi:cryptochrome/photolyase family protein [Halobellus limi]|uniref:Deoxyribodipyrimidine photo-lyase n=1 Tax=Halobellus limi TaxID=699433 RepID=A0A1H6AN53_9EURY|nr:deoxyribodipyrimidine photo-lyase [Halobellus limi]QCC47639.1 deoxyribodipyrimidine photo-lyase [Halobellus limi]SEG49206.1 deoxyribodipyrimidine photo-lyase [Halobellus limi]
MQIHWHRRDLRPADNRALAVAAGGAPPDDPGAPEGEEQSGEPTPVEDLGPVVPLFVFDDAVLEHAGDARVRYLLDALAELRAWYRERGSDLVVARGDPVEVLPELAAEYDAERVVWNRDYSGLARERDAGVRRALDEVDVDRASFHDAIFHEPGSITTNDGEHYSVYTYFWKKWRDREKPDPLPAPDADALAAVDGGDLPSITGLGFEEPEADVQRAGTDAARDRLETFCADGIYRYDEDRDYPTRDGVSRLSTDLKFGTIGIREVYAATADARERAAAEEAESVEEFQSQLAWREFYTHVLFFNPGVVSENFREYENDIEWRNDPDELDAWKRGETGYPIVDAGMRQLKAEAYIHNRVRMIVASFLTKDLRVDWREGYDHFREFLADHDTANDNGGWQWAASTGTDAQPYFRIFNPMTQGERYDPDAEYIKKYVPELRDVDPELIHGWHELSPTQRARTAGDYPEPIVDHGERREAALAMFEAARGEE